MKPTHEVFSSFRDHIEEYFRTWHKVSEYADRLGFDDASSFSSYFRRQTRTTPGAFRSRSRTGTAPASACMHG